MANPTNGTSNGFVTWPAPEGETASTDFALTVHGQPVFVYTARVREEILKATDSIWTHADNCAADLVSFGLFDFSSPVEVVITPKRAFKTASVHPVSAGLKPQVIDGTIRFVMERPAPLTVLLDGLDDIALHLFAHKPETDLPDPKDPNVMYYGPGYHDITTLTIRSGQTLYLAGGAILRAKLDPGEQGTLNPRTKLRSYSGSVITVSMAENARVAGRGIIDCRALPHAARSTLVAWQSRNVRFEGITIRHSCNWQTIIMNSQSVEVDGIQVIGGRLNTDGINTVSSHHVHIRNCFVRSHDDSIAVKTTKPDAPASDIRVENCVIWNDWGYALGVTYETRSPISHVTYRNCDILCVRHWALGVHVVDSATIQNITFENIRVEDLNNAARRWQHTPMLLRLGITKDMWGTDKETGHIQNVVLRSVSLTGSTAAASEILGKDAEHQVENVMLEKVTYLGKTVANAQDMKMKVNEFTKEIRYS
ncbi:MAG TPA: glycosyl hydrolase family 28 protein [Candidatus Methylacidiphilales bacterium]|nr:glycosyl hydrolase family 28 protein [Candidatus Methylacidiphilales bacterium]